MPALRDSRTAAAARALAARLTSLARSRRAWASTAGGAAALVMIFCASVLWGLPLEKSLSPLDSPTIVLVSADGKPFARRGAYMDEPVDAAALPAHVTGAFLAIEDRRFMDHAGVDLRGMGRALLTNLRAGKTVQGGSTITQQLAKNAFTEGERTFRRKAREAVIALYLEARLSKSEILSRYLSSVYFGEGVFGLRGAARHYFDKAPEDLSAGEAAMLAGLIKAPSRLSPFNDLEAAKERQTVVLAAMQETGLIDEKEAKAARAVKLREGRPDLPVGSWFADWVSAGAKDAFDRAYGEVRVQTTLDSRLQADAERILKRALDGPGKQMGATQGALVAMRPDGRVVAMVGGRDYKQSQFNRAVQAKRQPGSAFKLFVYLAAIRRGANPWTAVLDAPVRIGDWSPENYEGRYTGAPVPLRSAFARSSNVAAVRLAQDTGRPFVVDAARDFGLTGKLPDDFTIALGTGEVTLLELTAAYAGVAAGRAPITPFGVAADRPPAPVWRLSRHEQDSTLELLRAVVTSGTGTGAALPIPAFGKTGTTQDYRDAWFIGFAGDLVVGVWMGNDDNTPMKGVTGGSLPARVFREFMHKALERGMIGAPPFRPIEGLTVATLEDEPGAELPFMEDETYAADGLDWFVGRAEAAETPAPSPPVEGYLVPPPGAQPVPPPRRARPEGFDERGVLIPSGPPRRAPAPVIVPPPPAERPVYVPDENGAVG